MCIHVRSCVHLHLHVLLCGSCHQELVDRGLKSPPGVTELCRDTGGARGTVQEPATVATQVLQAEDSVDTEEDDEEIGERREDIGERREHRGESREKRKEERGETREERWEKREERAEMREERH